MTSNKKTILIFIDWYEPGFKAGGPIRSVANIVSHLKSYFNFKIITRNTDYTETTPYENIQSDQWTPIDQSTSIFYISKEQLNRKTIKNLIRETEHDHLYLNGLFSLYFTLIPSYYRKEKTSIAVRGMLSEGALGVKSAKKSMFLRVAKTLALFKHVTFQSTSENESEQIKKHFPNSNIVLASNLSQGTIYENFEPSVRKRKGELNLFFLGRVSPEKNTLYAMQLVKSISNANVTLDIYGAIYDQEYFKQCQEVISSTPSNVTINYKGLLKPYELTSQLKPYHAMLFPSTGENFGHAIIESLLNKKPVIISNKTPWRANGAIREHSLDDRDSFIESLLYYADLDDNNYQLIAQAALEYGNKSASSESKIKNYLALFA